MFHHIFEVAEALATPLIDQNIETNIKIFVDLKQNTIVAVESEDRSIVMEVEIIEDQIRAWISDFSTLNDKCVAILRAHFGKPTKNGSRLVRKVRRKAR